MTKTLSLHRAVPSTRGNTVSISKMIGANSLVSVSDFHFFLLQLMICYLSNPSFLFSTIVGRRGLIKCLFLSNELKQSYMDKRSRLGKGMLPIIIQGNSPRSVQDAIILWNSTLDWPRNFFLPRELVGICHCPQIRHMPKKHRGGRMPGTGGDAVEDWEARLPGLTASCFQVVNHHL